MFIILSGVGALADERGGISRGIMGGDGAPKPTPETKTKFADVKGVDEAKGELVEIVEHLRSPAKFTRLGGKLPKGLLLVGPGDGQDDAGESRRGGGWGSILHERLGIRGDVRGRGRQEGEEPVPRREGAAPCIVFIDEIDAGAARGTRRISRTPA